MLLYRKELTFIQTNHSSLESQVLDFPQAKKDRVYQAASNFRTHIVSFIMIFRKKHPWHLNHFQWERSRNNSRTYIRHNFFLHCTQWVLVSCIFFFFFFLSVLNDIRLPGECHFSSKMATYNRQNMCENATKLRQNQGSAGFSSKGTPSKRPDLWFIPQPKG